MGEVEGAGSGGGDGHWRGEVGRRECKKIGKMGERRRRREGGRAGK